MTEEFNLSEKRKEFRKDLDYALNKFDWGNSCLDAKAISILNEWKIKLANQDKEFIKRLKEEIGVVLNVKGYVRIDNELETELETQIDKLAGKDLI